MSSSSLLHGGTAALAALTTIFTPPPDCATSTWLLTTTQAPSQYPPFPTDGPSSCNIPGWVDNIEEGSFEFYSPAVCPSGFVVGPSCTSIQVKTSEGFPNVEAGETVAFCVPSGYSCTADTTDFHGGVWGMIQTGVAAAQITVAPAIQIRWRDSDLTVFPTHPLSPGVVISIGPQPTRAPPPPPPPPSSPPSRPPGATGGNGVIVVSLPTPPQSTLLTSTTSTSAAPTLLSYSPSSSATQPPVRNTEPTSLAETARSSSPPPTSATSAGPGGQSIDLTKASPMESTKPNRLPLGPIILACLVSVLVFGASAFFFLKRRRERRGNNPKQLPPLLPVGIGVWVGSSNGSGRKGGKGSKPSLWRTWAMAMRDKASRSGGRQPDHGTTRHDANEKSKVQGTKGWAACPAEGDPGSKQNPAELCQLGNGDDSEEQQRWSWVSKMFSIRAWRNDGQNEDEVKSSAVSSRRTTRSSRWTVSDAEGMMAERHQTLTALGALSPPVPAMPRLPTPLPAVLISNPKSPTLTLRPLTARSAFSMRSETTEMTDTSEENDMLGRLSPTRMSGYTGAGGLRSPWASSQRLSRISDGTFGPGGSRNSHSPSSRATPES